MPDDFDVLKYMELTICDSGRSHGKQTRNTQIENYRYTRTKLEYARTCGFYKALWKIAWKTDTQYPNRKLQIYSTRTKLEYAKTCGFYKALSFIGRKPVIETNRSSSSQNCTLQRRARAYCCTRRALWAFRKWSGMVLTFSFLLLFLIDWFVCSAVSPCTLCFLCFCFLSIIPEPTARSAVRGY